MWSIITAIFVEPRSDALEMGRAEALRNALERLRAQASPQYRDQLRIAGTQTLAAAFAARGLTPPPFGASMAWAAAPGLGLFRDAPTPGRELRPFQEDPELVAELQRLASESEGSPGPLVVHSNVQHDRWIWSAQEAYRRRQVYYFQFEASVRAGTLDVFNAPLERATSVSVDDVVQTCPAIEHPDCLSVCLHLLLELDALPNMLADTNARKLIPTRLQAPVLAPREKIQRLWGHFMAAANHRATALGSDALKESPNGS